MLFHDMMLQSGRAGRDNYLAAIHNSPGTTSNFTLLNHTNRGSLTLSATYDLQVIPNSMGVSLNTGLIAISSSNSVAYLTILKHNTGSVELVNTSNYGATNSPRTVDISPDGRFIAIGSNSNPNFTLLELTSGTISVSDTYHTGGAINFVKFNPNSSYIGIGSNTAPFFTLLNHNEGSVSLASTYNTGGNINSVDFNLDSEYVICSVSNSTYDFILLNNTGGIMSLANTYNDLSSFVGYYANFSKDGNYIAAGNFNNSYRPLMLDHTTPGTLALSSEFGPRGLGPRGPYDFSSDDAYLAIPSFDFVSPSIFPTVSLMSHSLGTVTLSDTYILEGSGGVCAGAKFL